MNCNYSPTETTAYPKVKYKEGFVESEKVKLQYLDWGGSGPVLVLICGLGDTPFLFENLAEELSQGLHVIGYSRRGHGKSNSKEEKYDNETLVSDLKLLLDSLHIDKASLLGWSSGGNEITEFASLYPESVDKLIYFDAGYDMSDGGFEKMVKSIPASAWPDSTTTNSLNAYRDWYHLFWVSDMAWNETLEANLLATVHVNADGSIEPVPSDSVFKEFLKEAIAYRRNYMGVRSPALVIYAKTFLLPPDRNSVTEALYDSIEKNIVSPWREANKERMKRELKEPIIVEAPEGSHISFLFLSQDFLFKTISSFLLEAK